MELDSEDLRPIITRMKRAHGHLATVIRMMEEGADCESVLTQLAAVNKALARSGFAIVSTGLQQCLSARADGEGLVGDDEPAVDVRKLEKLFLALA